MAKEQIGTIDCPCCGYAGGMRITKDRNGDPFGFCSGNCGVQMRVGGNADRVAAFYRNHPTIKKPTAEATPATHSAPAAAPAPATPTPPPPAAPARRSLLNLGV